MAAVVGLDVEGDEWLACCRGSLLKKYVKQLFPRDRMHTRRFCQHPIEIEQDRVVSPTESVITGAPSLTLWSFAPLIELTEM